MKIHVDMRFSLTPWTPRQRSLLCLGVLNRYNMVAKCVNPKGEFITPPLPSHLWRAELPIASFYIRHAPPWKEISPWRWDSEWGEGMCCLLWLDVCLYALVCSWNRGISYLELRGRSTWLWGWYNPLIIYSPLVSVFWYSHWMYKRDVNVPIFRFYTQPPTFLFKLIWIKFQCCTK